jgi:hypothetical protein
MAAATYEAATTIPADARSLIPPDGLPIMQFIKGWVSPPLSKVRVARVPWTKSTHARCIAGPFSISPNHLLIREPLLHACRHPPAGPRPI